MLVRAWGPMLVRTCALSSCAWWKLKAEGKDGGRDGDEMDGWMQGKKGRKGRSERGRERDGERNDWMATRQCLRSLMMRV
jgi:hypothetical protein